MPNNYYRGTIEQIATELKAAKDHAWQVHPGDATRRTWFCLKCHAQGDIERGGGGRMKFSVNTPARFPCDSRGQAAIAVSIACDVLALPKWVLEENIPQDLMEDLQALRVLVASLDSRAMQATGWWTCAYHASHFAAGTQCPDFRNGLVRGARGQCLVEREVAA